MANVKVVKRTVETEVVLEQKEFEALNEFIRQYGSVRPEMAGSWMKRTGYKLWENASRVTRAVERQMREVRAR